MCHYCLSTTQFSLLFAVTMVTLGFLVFCLFGVAGALLQLYVSSCFIFGVTCVFLQLVFCLFGVAGALLQLYVSSCFIFGVVCVFFTVIRFS